MTALTRAYVWQDEALCRKSPEPEIWFPESLRGHTEDSKIAIQICGVCSVNQECLSFALDREEPYGIYGGLMPSERGIPRWRRQP